MRQIMCQKSAGGHGFPFRKRLETWEAATSEPYRLHWRASYTAMSTPCSAGVHDGITCITRIALDQPNRQMLKDLRCTNPEEFEQRSH